MSSILSYNFGWQDWAVFAAMLVISFLIAVINGIISRRKKDAKSEFLMGSRSVPLIPTAVSLMASFISSITILGYPADVYVTGAQYAFTPAGWMLGGAIILLFIVPLLYPLEMTSIYEYMERRYHSRATRLICALIGILHQNVYVGLCIFGPCTAMEAMTGFESWKSVLIISLAATVPTAIGGLKGVIWMDFFQGMVMYGALIAVLVAGSAEVGGMTGAVNVFAKYNSKVDTSGDPTKYTCWGALFGSAFTWLGHMGVSQAGFQRYGALRTITLSRVAVFLGLLIQVSVVSLSFMCGVIIYAFFAGQGCDPIGTNMLSSLNHLMPVIVQKVLNFPGVPGLFMASVFSGAYSSMTSSLTAISANMWEDVFKPSLGHKGERFHMLTIRIVIVVAGLIGMAVAFLCLFAGGSILQLALAFINAVTGPVVGCFLLSSLFPMANYIGAMVSTVLALFLTLWMSLGAYVHVISKVTLPPVADVNCTMQEFIDYYNQTAASYSLNFTTATTTTAAPTTTPASAPEEENLLYDFYAVSYIWYGLFAAATVVVLGLIISLITRPCVGPQRVQKRYLMWVAHCWPIDVIENEDDDDFELESKKSSFKDPDRDMNGKTNGYHHDNTAYHNGSNGHVDTHM